MNTQATFRDHDSRLSQRRQVSIIQFLDSQGGGTQQHFRLGLSFTQVFKPFSPEGTSRSSGASRPPGGHSHGGYTHEISRNRKRWILPVPTPHGGSLLAQRRLLVHPASNGNTRSVARSMCRRGRNRQPLGQATQLRNQGLRAVPLSRRKSGPHKLFYFLPHHESVRAAREFMPDLEIGLDGRGLVALQLICQAE